MDSPQQKLEVLREALKHRIEQIQLQEEMTKDLETELNKTKTDLAILQRKYGSNGNIEVTDSSLTSSIVENSTDTRLSDLHSFLIVTSEKLEDILNNWLQILNEDSEEHCRCKPTIIKDADIIRSIRRDLEQFTSQIPKVRFKKSSSVHSSSNSSEKGKLTPDVVSIRDLDEFKTKAVILVAALEEMKEQIDKLYSISKKYLTEVTEDVEKGQREECEAKIEKLHLEYDDALEFIKNFLCNLEEFSTEEEASKVINKCYPCQDKRDSSTQSENMISDVITDLISKMTNKEDEVKKKMSQMEDQNKEIENQSEVITKLRTTLKGTREQIKEMEIEIAENLKNKELAEQLRLRSESTVSNLSSELQLLQKELLKSKDDSSNVQHLQSSCEKQKEEIDSLNEKLQSFEKLLANKEEMLKLLQDNLKKRESQNDALNSKIHELEEEISSLKKQLDEKQTVIKDLQQAVQKTKQQSQFEMEKQENIIETLQFELCGLESQYSVMYKEVVEKDHKLEALRDENVDLRGQVFTISQDVEINIEELKETKKDLELRTTLATNLKKALDERESEINDLVNEIKALEKELDDFQCKAKEDDNLIVELRDKIEKLQDEKYRIRESFEVALANTEHQLMMERNNACTEKHKNEITILKLEEKLLKLQEENKVLREQVIDCDLQEEINAKFDDLAILLRSGEERQHLYEEKINCLQKHLEESLEEHEKERYKLIRRLEEERRENFKNKTILEKLDEIVKCSKTAEIGLKSFVEHCQDDINDLRNENAELKDELEVRRQQVLDIECKETNEFKVLDRLVTHLKCQKKELKNRCLFLETELSREIKIRDVLEDRIEELNNVLGGKTLEFNNLSQKHNELSSKFKEAFTKLKHTEGELMCVREEARQSCENSVASHEAYEDVRDEVLKEREDKQFLQRMVDQKSLEYSELMTRCETLQTELDVMKNETSVSQAAADNHIQQLQKEVKFLKHEIKVSQDNYATVAEDWKKVQADLLESCKREAAVQQEYTEREKEWSLSLQEALLDKEHLAGTVADLQLFIEDNKHQYDEELERNVSEMKQKVQESVTEAEDTKYKFVTLKNEYEKLQKSYQSVLEKVGVLERKKQNYEKVLSESDAEIFKLNNIKASLETNMVQINMENELLREKVNASLHLGKMTEKEILRISEENEKLKHLKQKLSSKIKELISKIKALEDQVIPDLEAEIIEKNSLIENLKFELQDANASCEKMREESLIVVQNTKKYLAAQKMVNETLRSRLESSNAENSILDNEKRALDQQLKVVTRMNEFLVSELQSLKREESDVGPSSYSPMPWSCDKVEKEVSTEYIVESGFQSMQPSPTDLIYDMQQFTHELKRTNSYWDNMVRQTSESDGYQSSASAKY